MLASTANRISKRIVKHAASNVYTKCLYQKKWQTEICHFTMSIQCFPVHATHLPRRSVPDRSIAPIPYRPVGPFLVSTIPILGSPVPCLPLPRSQHHTGLSARSTPNPVHPYTSSPYLSSACHAPPKLSLAFDHHTDLKVRSMQSIAFLAQALLS